VVIAEPPVFTGAVKAIDAEAFDATGFPIAGGPGGVPYVMATGSLSAPPLEGLRVTGPTAVGVIANVCGAEEAVKVRVTGVKRPPPDGVMVMVPV
jgi:hypothetical protein